MKPEKTLITKDGKILLCDMLFIGGRPHLVFEWDSNNNPSKIFPLDIKFLKLSNSGYGEQYIYEGLID